ncbi:MAG: purine-nucleoside phosphorylase [Lentisphaerae bacterium]|jgi:purine-nucleoside phosphorylase|nr:purine-nucleoside phosphorylase [Lentisphaerota bacterium]
MENQINQSVLDAAEAALRKIWPDAAPRCGLVLGSGWDEVVADLSGETIDYADIPGLGATGVLGHAGKLRRASVDGMELFIFQGRRHWYEGVGWTPIILPAYLLHAFGADTLLLTNAAGGISSALPPGTIMVIEDHINMLGSNPLIGPHNPRLGLRFPDQSAVYDKALRHQLMNAGADAAGIYLATTGPTFETPAEIRCFERMGADAVGMSTVPEAIVANALGLRTAGLSCICNWAAGISPVKLTHEDVNAVAAQTMPRMKKLIENFLSELAKETD